MTEAAESKSAPKKEAADASVGPSSDAKFVPIYFYRPGLRLLHASIALSDEPGTYARVLNALPVPGVDLLHSSSDGGHGDRAIVHLYAAVDPDLTAEKLSALLRKVPGVVDASTDHGVDGLLVDTSYPLRIAGGSQAVVIDRDHLARMLDVAREQLGSGGAVLLYDQGLTLGRARWEETVTLLGRNFALQHLSYLGHWYSARGMGRMDVIEVDLERGKARIRIADSFECAEHTSRAPYSQMVRGLVAGFLSVLWESPAGCRETHCVAMGELYCEFEVERLAPEPANGTLP